MGMPAGKEGDHNTAVDTHIILVPPQVGKIPTPRPHPFDGVINNNLSSDVKIMGMFAATVGSMADNLPPHIPEGGTFQDPPRNKGEITSGSPTVMINGKPAARNGGTPPTRQHTVDLPVWNIILSAPVM